MDLTNSADVVAIFTDTAPMEEINDFCEATTRIAKTVIVKNFTGCRLAVARDAADEIEALRLW